MWSKKLLKTQQNLQKYERIIYYKIMYTYKNMLEYTYDGFYHGFSWFWLNLCCKSELELACLFMKIHE